MLTQQNYSFCSSVPIRDAKSANDIQPHFVGDTSPGEILTHSGASLDTADTITIQIPAREQTPGNNPTNKNVPRKIK